MLDLHWTRLTLYCPLTSPLPRDVLEAHVTRALGVAPDRALSWTIASEQPPGRLVLEVQQGDHYTAYTLNYYVMLGETLVQGPVWLKALGMELFVAFGARLGFGRAGEAPLEDPIGLELGALVIPYHGIVLLDAAYYALVEELIQYNGRPPFWTTETFGPDQARCMTWPGWFGAPGETPPYALWPWEIDLPTPRHDRNYSQVAIAGLDAKPSLDADNDRLMQWLEDNPALKIDPQPCGLSLEAWLLLATHQCAQWRQLPTERVVRDGRLVVPLETILNDPSLALTVALSACGTVPLVYARRQRVNLSINHWEADRGAELTFPVEDNHHDDVDYKGERWQWQLIRTLVERLPHPWWVGGLGYHAVGVCSADLNDPDTREFVPVILQTTPNGLRGHVHEGWFEAPEALPPQGDDVSGEGS